MKNTDKLKPITRNHIRYSILYYGVWNGIAKLTSGKMVVITLTNIASLNNPELLEFYKLIS